MNTTKLSFAAMLGAFTLSGCQRMGVDQGYAVKADELNPTPIMVDDAMQRRTWEPVSAKYAKMESFAGPTGFMWRQNYEENDRRWYVLDTGVFLANVVSMPFVYARTRPWDEAGYRAITVEPTYTASAPIPESPAMMESTPDPIMPTDPAEQPAAEPMPEPPAVTEDPATVPPTTGPSQPSA